MPRILRRQCLVNFHNGLKAHYTIPVLWRRRLKRAEPAGERGHSHFLRLGVLKAHLSDAKVVGEELTYGVLYQPVGQDGRSPQNHHIKQNKQTTPEYCSFCLGSLFLFFLFSVSFLPFPCIPSSFFPFPSSLPPYPPSLSLIEVGLELCFLVFSEFENKEMFGLTLGQIAEIAQSSTMT